MCRNGPLTQKSPPMPEGKGGLSDAVVKVRGVVSCGDSYKIGQLINLATNACEGLLEQTTRRIVSK